MSGVTKLGTGLAVVFVLSIVALLAELFYVLWRRQRFRQQNHASDNPEFPGDPFSNPSKELLYFFCWKTQTRIEPTGATDAQTIRVTPDALPEDTTDELKWQGLYGPSRVLFTIKEEEREDMESEKSSSVEKKQNTKRVSLEECFGVVVGTVPEVAVMIGVDGATPFSTPCGSPFYYTPSPSPTREVENDGGNLTDSPETDGTVVLGGEVVQIESPEGGVFGNNTVSFISLDVHGK